MTNFSALETYQKLGQFHSNTEDLYTSDGTNGLLLVNVNNLTFGRCRKA